MTLLQVEQIVAVADTKNISKAAEKLYMNQSNLSSSVSKLEKELGLKLFRRSNSGVELTEHGSACLPYFKKILANIKSIDYYCLENRNNAASGTVTEHISISSVNYGFLPHATNTFNKEHPETNLRVSIIEMSGNMGLEMVENNQTDFGIFTLYPFSEKEKLIQIKNICLSLSISARSGPEYM